MADIKKKFPEVTASTSVQSTALVLLYQNGNPETATVTDIVSTATTTFATAAQYRSKTGSVAVSPAIAYSAADYVALSDAASIAWDMNLGINFSVTLAGNRTLAFPSNPTFRQRGTIKITQDATGSRTLTLATSAGFYTESGAALLDIGLDANEVSYVDYFVEESGFIRMVPSQWVAV